MKKIFVVLWCALTTFIAPVWLCIVYLCMSGEIYQVDRTFDKGTAGIIGVILLFLWILLTLVPDILYFRQIRVYGKRFIWLSLGTMALLVLLCYGICGWDVIHFLATPNGM